jgi:hypothetical protein
MVIIPLAAFLCLRCRPFAWRAICIHCSERNWMGNGCTNTRSPLAAMSCVIRRASRRWVHSWPVGHSPSWLRECVIVAFGETSAHQRHLPRETRLVNGTEGRVFAFSFDADSDIKQQLVRPNKRLSHPRACTLLAAHGFVMMCECHFQIQGAMS